MQIRGKSALSDHKQEWQKLYDFYSKQDSETMQYRARCVKGLLDGTSYDYMDTSPPK